MLKIVLFEPEIPPNTGNIIRLAANTGFELHLIEPLGFSLDEKSVRRAGMDYRELSLVSSHKNWDTFIAKESPQRIFAITTKGNNNLFDNKFKEGDAIVFGPETRGLSKEFCNALPKQHLLRIPMQQDSRSLNLSNAVAIAAYEAWRQLAFAGASSHQS